MPNKKEKLSLEKLKQIEELQKMMIKQTGNKNTIGKQPQAMPAGLPGMAKKPSIFTPKGLLISILQGMQSSVKFIDYFIDFVAKTILSISTTFSKSCSLALSNAFTSATQSDGPNC